MRKILAILSLAAAMTAVSAAPALAAGPSIPKDCHEWNALLHINNVKDCDNS